MIRSSEFEKVALAPLPCHTDFYVSLCNSLDSLFLLAVALRTIKNTQHRKEASPSPPHQEPLSSKPVSAMEEKSRKPEGACGRQLFAWSRVCEGMQR